MKLIRKLKACFTLFNDGSSLHSWLYRAVDEGDLKMVKTLIALGADSNYDGPDILELCAIKGELEILEFLISYGKVNDFNLSKALKLACENGHVDMAKYLIEKGAVIGDGALIETFSSDRAEMAELLLSNGVSLKDAVEVATANISYGNEKVVKLLLKKRAISSKELAQSIGSELLRWFPDHYNYSLFKSCVRNGFDVQSNDNQALMEIAESGSYAELKFVVEHGANIHARDNSAVSISSRNRDCYKTLFLIRNGADFSKIDKKFVVSLIVDNRYVELEFFLESGLDVKLDHELAIKTAVFKCDHENKISMIKLLFQYGASDENIPLAWIDDDEVRTLIENRRLNRKLNNELGITQPKRKLMKI